MVTLDKEGFNDLFLGWKADALLGKNDEFIKSKFSSTPEGQDKAEMLLGFLTTAKGQSASTGKIIASFQLMCSQR